MRTRTLFIIAAIIAMLTGGGIYAVVSSADAEETSKSPTTLIGEWHQIEGADGILMHAEINPGSIQIDMQLRDDNSSYIYWMGSFDTNKNPANSWTTKSLVDSDATANSLFGSLEEIKPFVYKSGDLSFKFSIMGAKTTIHLAKTKK